jgi:hypothetical protein
LSALAKEGQRTLLVLDSASWQKSATLSWHHIQPVYLPPYSSDFNAVERKGARPGLTNAGHPPVMCLTAPNWWRPLLSVSRFALATEKVIHTEDVGAKELSCFFQKGWR